MNASPTADAALRVDRLVKRYGALEAVREVSFHIEPGEIFGLLGPNGAGKTSTIAMIATQRRATSGDAFVFGHSVITDVAAVRRVIGMVPQELALYPELTARENLHFFGRMYGVAMPRRGERVADLLELAGLTTRADDRVGSFSGGMKRRLNLVVGLVHEPRLILLDEPTVGVDPQSRDRLFALVAHLRETGAAVLYTTHHLEEAERLCDRLAIMDGGRIVATGRLDQLLAGAGCAEVIELRGLAPEADLGGLRTTPEVLRVESTDRGVRLFVNGAARLLGPLQAALGPRADDVTVTITPASLETLFLQLTGRALRDP